MYLRPHLFQVENWRIFATGSCYYCLPASSSEEAPLGGPSTPTLCPRARVERPEVRHWAEQHMRRSPSCVPCMPVKVATFETHRASIGAAKGGRTQCPGLWLVWAAGWLGAAGVREPIVRVHEHGRRIARTDSSCSPSPPCPKRGPLSRRPPQCTTSPPPLGCLTRSIFPPSS